MRFVFYNIVVRIYGLYLRTINKFGWSSPKSDEYFTRFLNQRLVHILVIIVTVSLLFVNLTVKTKADSLTDSSQQTTILAELVKSELGQFEEDEQLIVETFNREEVISSVQKSYFDNLSSFRPQLKVTMNDADEKPESLVDEGLVTIQGGAAIVNPDLVLTRISKKPREENVEHIVRPGDTVSAIAVEYEVSVSTILWENNLSAYSMIRPGDKLNIPPVSGVTHKVAKGENINSIASKYKVEVEKVTEFNKLEKDEKLQIGQKIFIPGGKKVTYPTYEPSRYTGFTAIRNIVKAPNAKPVASNKMNWPTVGKRITQYYSWRHYAVDIANKIGTPIYAADAGTIEYAGWGKGYGNQIVIDHGGGKKTRYAHLSKFYVKKGDNVSKGQTIAAMGSTGWSTGPHLHFEVIINGRKYNPLNYIK